MMASAAVSGRTRAAVPRSGRAKDALLTAAGIVGLLGVLWFAVAALFGFSIVVVLTGSMAPGLPTGSALLVQDDVAAADLAVGDIVTVPREGYTLPVTHRIIAIEAGSISAGETSAARLITMQGDANATPDREPYLVETVQRAIVGAPLVGYLIRVLQTPLMMGALTLLVAALVIWAFWPPRADAAVDDDTDSVTTDAAGPTLECTPAGRRHREGHR